MTIRRLLLPAILASTLLLAACSVDTPPEASGASPLAYAPADTPYVFGMVEPMPHNLVEQFLDRGDRMSELYTSMFSELRAKLAAEDADSLAGKFVEALASEFAGKSLRESIAQFGIDGHQRSALFGIGLVPVLRMELTDATALPALIERLEKKVGASLTTAKVGEQPYWAIDFGKADAPLFLLAAVVDQQLVISLSPGKPDDGTLRTLLGLTPPPANLLDSGRLQSLQSRHHFLASMLGEIDSQRLLDSVAGPATPLESAFLSALETEKPAITPECRVEYGRLAELLPRLAIGYTRMDATHMDQVSTLETAPALSKALMTLRAPMPGMKAVTDTTAMDFGYSLKLSAIPALARQFAQAVNSAAFSCDELLWLNEAAQQAPSVGNNPAIYAAAPVFGGIHLIVDQLKLSAEMKPEQIKGSLLIGSDNPQSLLGMAKSYVPQLASLDVKTDGSLQKLDLPAIPELDMALPTWVSANTNMVGIAFGDGADADIVARMESDASEQPLMVMGYNGALYGDIMQTVMNKAATEAKSDEERVQMQRTAAMMKQIYGEWIRRFGMRIDLTEQGIVFTQNITTAP